MRKFAPKNKYETVMAQIDEFFFDTNRVEGITKSYGIDVMPTYIGFYNRKT